MVIAGSKIDSAVNDEGEEVVISGLSGIYPESDNVREYIDNLLNKVDMVTHDGRRWSVPHPEIPKRSGKINGLTKFDAGFFGVHQRQVNTMDSMCRLLIEKTAEAIYDAGMHPSELENSKTGVFLGVCFSESEKLWFYQKLISNNFCVTGCMRSIISNRISYWLKLKGPSFILDTACSSSSYAFEHAYRAIKSGQCDNAIVGGSNLCLHPNVTLQFARLGVLSMDGTCKCFDANAQGYVRSEAVCVMFLQRAKNSRRIYAKVVHAKTNCDGYKEQGITYPSGPMQQQLLEEFYHETKIDPLRLSFIEAHGTGTRVGDPEEVHSLDKVFCTGRKNPLLIGSVKCNIGHTEPVSGLCSISKVLLAMETGFIPPNIHYNTPRSGATALEEGRMLVLTEKTPFKDKNVLVGVNSFGFGGANCHVLLEWNEKNKVKQGEPDDNVPRLICASGRVEEAVTAIFDDVASRTLDFEFVGLLQNIFKNNTVSHKYRGFAIVSKTGELERNVSVYKGGKAPLAVVFSGFTTWSSVSSEWFALPAFRNTLKRIDSILLMKGTNFKEILLDIIENVQITIYKKLVVFSALQICLADIFKHLTLNPDYIFGLLDGEFIAAYCLGRLTLEQTVLCIHCLGNALDTLYEENNKGKLNNELDLKEAIPEIKTQLLLDFQEVLQQAKVNPNDLLYNLFEHKQISLPKRAFVVEIGNTKSDFGLGPKQLETGPLALLQLLGQLYLNGFDINLQNLYPKINYPVSRGTPSISPLIKWNHSEDWFVAFYEPEGEIKSGERIFKITLRENEWSYLAGHVIDGRNLFPATGYLLLVWETVAMMTERLINDTAIAFENVKFLRATTIPKDNSLELYVMVQRTSGQFEVIEGGVCVVTGRVYVPEDVAKEITQLPSVSSTEDYLPLSEKDVYKELKLRGYQYSGAFRAIKQCDNSAERGAVEWTGNFVAFMDNMLQLQILLADTRSLYVPTGIAKLVIDPQTHLNCAKSLGDNPQIPVYVSKESMSIRSGGIQVVGLGASAIARRKQTADPVLERHVFVPNEAHLTTEESVRVNMQIILDNLGGTKVKVYEVIDEIANHEAIAGVVFDVLADQPLIQPDITVLTKKSIEIANVTVQQGFLPKEKEATLVIGTQIFTRIILQQQSFEAIKENGFILSREAKDFKDHNLDTLEIVTTHTTEQETLVLFRKPSKPPKPVVVNIQDTNDFSWLKPLQENTNNGLPVVVYAENSPQSGILGFVNCLRREPTGKRVTGFFIDGEAPKFDINTEFYHKQYQKGLGINVFKAGKWGTYRHLLLEKEPSVQREHCYVNATVRGDLSSLRWIEGNLTSKTVLAPEQTLVQIYYSSLNFRDVMTASGRIDVDSVTRDRFKQECVQGFEFSGRDSKGKRITGMVTSAALATSLAADINLLVEIPEQWSMEEAATVPVVYATTLYAFFVRGGLKPGQSVLIHAGTGGVGQAAINIALYYNCIVFTTVGTPEKRAFIKKHFPQIPESHIGNSRDISFEQVVMRGTRGRGVDFVLNSLAEEKLQASVRCLAPGGSFLEIGKFDLAKDNQLRLELMRSGASFHGIMVDQFFESSVKEKANLMGYLRDGLKNGSIKPLVRTVFDMEEVEKAFRFMGAGKHLGKVLIKVREEESEKKVVPQMRLFNGTPRYFCDSEGSYIITGGLGGSGLELADWLILRGARNLVLTSRTGVKNGYQAFRIRIWKSYGATVLISTADITTESGCVSLLEEANHLGPIKAIFNLAVVLRDAIIENQSEDKYVDSFGPKAVAVTHLDHLTRQLCPHLTDFVVFSSVSCGRGNAGQTNYGMANSVMERICEQRSLDGFPALAIQWGAIGEVGLVAEMQEQQTEIEIGGTLQQRISSCLSVMDQFLRQKEPVVSSMVVAEKRSSGAADNVVDCVANIMGIKNLKTVSHQSTLAELGMDSMMAVEIKQTLEREFEVFLTAQDIRNLTFERLYSIKSESEHKGEVSKDGVQETYLQLQLQFIGDEATANERVVVLESLAEEPTVYMVPGIEGMAPVLKVLAKNIKGRVCCLQYDLQSDSIEKMGYYIYESIKSQKHKEKRLIVVAYSYGCILTLEALALLEKDGYTADVILIDGAADMLKPVIRQQIGEAEDLAIFETNVLCAIISQFKTIEVVAKQRESFLACKNFEERLDLAFADVPVNEQHSLDYRKRVAEAFFKRVLALAKYRAQITELKSSVELLRPESQSVQNIEDDYNISKIVGRAVDVKWFKGNHLSIRENTDVVDYINEWLEKIGKKE